MKPVGPLILALVCAVTAWGQQPLMTPVSAGGLNQPSQATQFTKFDLDFPGGPPARLVAAIEKATGKPLNAIIPTEHADVPLPPLKMRNVTAPRLFESLQQGSMREVRYETGPIYAGPVGKTMTSYQTAKVAYGFQSLNPLNGDDTIWTFFVQGAPLPTPDPIACRYYQLEPYLESYSIDDITTAIQTGWRMLGEVKVPELSFHKETKLLIAVGNPAELSLIDDVLKQLQLKQASPGENPAPAAAPKPDESK